MFERKKSTNKIFKFELIKLEKGKRILTSSGLIFFGLIFANLIDLDHVYSRIIGKVGWTATACSHYFSECSFGFYPLHTLLVFIIGIILSSLIIFKNKLIKFIGWIGIGLVIHFILDFIMWKTRFGF